MSKFKLPIIDGKEVSIEEVFGNETTFTDEFLIKKEQMKKILKAIGLAEEIEGDVEKQIYTTDKKKLDNLLTLEDGQRIAIESQIGTSDMEHIAKLPYYMENLRNKDDGEVMIGILVAEEFNQEAIDYYERLNDIEYFDLYLVKSVLVKVGDNVVFMPQLISPTPTTNNFKNLKKQRDEKFVGEPHFDNRDLVIAHLKSLGYTPKEKAPNKDAYIEIKFSKDTYTIVAGIRASGKINLWVIPISGREFASTPSEDVFNIRKGYAVLKDIPLAKDFEEFKKGLDIILNNL